MSTQQLSRLELFNLRYQRDRLRNSRGPVYMIFDRNSGIRKQVIEEKDLYKFLDRKQYVIEIGDRSQLIKEFQRKIDNVISTC